MSDCARAVHVNDHEAGFKTIEGLKDDLRLIVLFFQCLVDRDGRQARIFVSLLITAMFLSKHLLIDWHWEERFFVEWAVHNDNYGNTMQIHTTFMDAMKRQQ